MPVIHPKSLIFGVVSLSSMVVSFIAALPQIHIDADHKITLVFRILLTALFIWHAFTGKKDNPRDEFRASVTLGIVSLLLGLLSLFRPRAQFELAAIVVGALYLLAAVYYLQAALQERQFLRQIRADLDQE